MVDRGGVDRNTETTVRDHTNRIARAAWLCAFVVPLILAALLLGAKSSQASAPVPGAVSFAFEEDEEEFGFEEEGEGEFAEEDELEFAEAECEIAADEVEEGEITQAEADEFCREVTEAAKESAAEGPKASASVRCPIRSLTAHASTHHKTLKLTIGYTTLSPIRATIRIHGVGSFKRHLGRSGVLRFTKKLGRKRPRKRIAIHIRVPASASGRRCGLVEVVANKVV